MKSPSPHSRTSTYALSRIDTILALSVVLLWALCFPLISAGLEMAPPLLFGALRSVIAGAAILLPAFILQMPLPTDWRVWLGILGVGLTYSSLGFAGMFMAGGSISPGLATVLANTQPLIAAGLAYFALNERLGPRRRAAIAVGFSGILLVAIPGFGGGSADGSLAGIGFILLGALGVAIGNVLLKRLSVEVDLLVLTGWQFILGSLPLFISSFAMEAPRAIIGEGSFWLILAALALPGTALAFVIWAYLLRRNSLTRLNTFTFLTPVVALVIGAIGFSEKLSFVEGIGIAMTMAGAWWAVRAKAIDHTPEARPSTTMSHHIQVEATAANTQHSKQVDMVRGEAKCIRAGDNQQAIHIDPYPPLASPYKLFHEVKRRSLFE